MGLGTLPRPDGADVRRKLREIRDAFDFVKFGDNPRARARVSPWAAAAVALAEGVEPIVHVGCRDRNRLALQSDLLGGRLLGVRNVLCLRGDEIEVSDQPEARAVRDLDVVDLIGLAAEEFCVLAAGDPAVGASDEHVARLRTKIAAGARLLETQPVFKLDAFARWLRHLREAGIDVPVLVDVSLVATPTEAELLERIPFVAAPRDLPARLGRDRGAGIALAAELVAGLLELEGVAGCHLSPIGGDPAMALAGSSASGELRRACPAQRDARPRRDRPLLRLLQRRHARAARLARRRARPAAHVPQIEDSIGWPRRRIASVLGGVAHLRHTEFGGRRP